MVAITALATVLLLAQPGPVSGNLDVSLRPVWVGDDTHLAFIGDDGTELCWYWVALGEEPQRITVTPPMESPRLVWWSPDGSRLAYVAVIDGKRMLYVTEFPGGHSQPFSVLGGIQPEVAWSPDSKRLAFSRRYESGAELPYEVFVLESNGTGPMASVRMDSPAQHLAWAPDNDRFTYVTSLGGAPRLFVTALAQAAALPCNPQLTVLPRSVVWSPDGRNLSFSGTAEPRNGYRLYWTRSHGSLPAQRVTGSAYAGNEPALWSSDGKWLVWKLASRSHPVRGSLHLSPTDAMSRYRVLDKAPTWGNEPQFNRDCSKLAYTGYENADGSGARVVVLGLDEARARREIKLGEVTDTPQFSPSGNKLAVLAGPREKRSLYVVDLTTE